MKWILGVVGFSVCSAFVYGAGIPTVEQPVNGYGTAETIAISSNTWTKVPTAQTSGRFGILVSNPSSNPLPVVGHFGNCSSTSLATTVRPIEIVSSTSTTNNRYFSMREDVCLWLFSLQTAVSSVNVHVQEVKQ